MDSIYSILFRSEVTKMRHHFPLPVIDNAELKEFCEEHNLYEAVAAGYHYAHKFFPKAKKIEIDFHPPYREDEPEEAYIAFLIETNMTIEEVRKAESEFFKATNDIPGAFYIIPLHRFAK